MSSQAVLEDMSDQEPMETQSSFNNAYKRWSKIHDKVAMKFCSQDQVNELAGKAVAKSLIDTAMLAAVVNPTKTFSDTERAFILILNLHERAFSVPGVFDHLLDSFEGEYYKNMRERLKTKRDQARQSGNQHPEANVLINSTDILVSMVSQALIDIANKLLTKTAISVQLHDTIVDPQNNHMRLCLEKVLQSIGKEIEKDPKKLLNVIEIFETMGQYYQDVCDALKGEEDVDYN